MRPDIQLAQEHYKVMSNLLMSTIVPEQAHKLPSAKFNKRVVALGQSIVRELSCPLAFGEWKRKRERERELGGERERERERDTEKSTTKNDLQETPSVPSLWISRRHPTPAHCSPIRSTATTTSWHGGTPFLQKRSLKSRNTRTSSTDSPTSLERDIIFIGTPNLCSPHHRHRPTVI